MMLTDETMDDSLIERRQKEIKKLQEDVEKLNNTIVTLKSENKALEEQISDMQTQYILLDAMNAELKGKLLIYEHDPIIYEEDDGDFIIKVWNKDKNRYVIFAQFYESADFEEDLEEFCKEFVLELKDAYLVE